MNILILGGTGAMGIHLARIFAADTGNSVTVTTRSKIKNAGGIDYVRGNAHDGVFLESLLSKNWDYIVDFMAYSTEEFKARSEKLLDSTAHYVFLSSSRVYAKSDAPITETSPRLLDVCQNAEYLATDEYALAKARQEDILFKGVKKGKKNFSIIRPYITYAENRLQLGVLEKETWLWIALNLGAIIFSSDIAQRTTTLSYGVDVARGIAALCGKDAAFGEAFHITVGEGIKWERVHEIYRDTLKENKIQFEEFWQEKTRRLEGAGKWQVMFDRYYDRVFDNSKISRFVDTEKFTKPEEGLKKCLCAFLQNPEFRWLDVREVLRLSKDAGKKIPLSKIKGARQKIKYTLVKFKLM